MKIQDRHEDSLDSCYPVGDRHLEGDCERLDLKPLENSQTLGQELQRRHSQSVSVLSNSWEMYKDQVLQYERLMRLERLSTQEAQTLEELLESAARDNRLGFWLGVVDERVLEDQGFLTPEAIQQYEQQQIQSRRDSKLSCRYHPQEVD